MEINSNSENFTTRSDVNQLAAAILEVMEAADKHGIKGWLCYGALLGMIREQRLLPWNNDAELGCWFETGIEEKMKIICDDMSSKGYWATYYSTIGALNVKKNEDVIVNLNIFWRENNNAVRPHERPAGSKGSPASRLCYWLSVVLGSYSTGLLPNTKRIFTFRTITKWLVVRVVRLLSPRWRKKLALIMLKASRNMGGLYKKTALPATFFDDFRFNEFYGGNVRIPAESESLVRFIYGEQWMIPKENWSFYAAENKNESGIVFLDEDWDYQSMKII